MLDCEKCRDCLLARLLAIDSAQQLFCSSLKHRVVLALADCDFVAEAEAKVRRAILGPALLSRALEATATSLHGADIVLAKFWDVLQLALLCGKL